MDRLKFLFLISLLVIIIFTQTYFLYQDEPNPIVHDEYLIELPQFRVGVNETTKQTNQKTIQEEIKPLFTHKIYKPNEEQLKIIRDLTGSYIIKAENARQNINKSLRLEDINSLPPDLRYAIFVKENETWGWANKMLGILSTFLFALLTERAFILDDAHVASVINWPYNITYDAKKMEGIPSVKYKNFNGCFWKHTNIASFLDRISLEETYPHPVAYYSTNCPIFHWISMNPKYIPKLIELELLPQNLTVSQNGFYVASALSSVLFYDMNPRIKKKVDLEKEKWKSNDLFVIGLQIRVGGSGDAHFRTNLDNFWKCGRYLAQGRSKVKYFIASDSKEVLKQANTIFPNQVIIYEGNVKHIGRDEKFTQEEIDKVILDNFLLGECDELVISQQSTFGGIAAIRVGKIPMVVDLGQHSHLSNGNGCFLASVEEGPGGIPDTIIW